MKDSDSYCLQQVKGELDMHESMQTFVLDVMSILDLLSAPCSSSLGSRSTLGRSSASSGTMGTRGKKKWKKSRDASTLLVC